MPIHLTLDPAPDRLEPYPTPFRHTLTAVAPQPGEPVGALDSEALAVGDDGEVARYVVTEVENQNKEKEKVPEGWQPEPLLGASGLHTPRLRAVAWPTPSRAYAVGVLGEMWLWRKETGLWEKDPATPLNFRGNLLGLAFDRRHPNSNARNRDEGMPSDSRGCCSATARRGPRNRKRTCRRKPRARASPRSRSPARKRSSPSASSTS